MTGYNSAAPCYVLPCSTGFDLSEPPTKLHGDHATTTDPWLVVSRVARCANGCVANRQNGASWMGDGCGKLDVVDVCKRKRETLILLPWNLPTLTRTRTGCEGESSHFTAHTIPHGCIWN